MYNFLQSRGVAQTTTSILDGELCSISERLKPVVKKLPILDVCKDAGHASEKISLNVEKRELSKMLIRIKLQKQPGVFYKKCVLKYFAKFTEKRLCQSLFFSKLQAYGCGTKRNSGTGVFRLVL